MGDWPNWTTAYNYVAAGWDGIKLWTDASAAYSTQAWTHYYAGQVLPAIYDILMCIDRHYMALALADTYDLTYTEPYAIKWCLKYLQAGIGSKPTMGDILTAMLTAKYDELTSFVGIEDAYRSAIWNQPFNAEYYAALARGFMK
jgi:hypothetical protein